MKQRMGIFSREISNLSTKFKVMIISCVHCTLTNSLPLREIFSVLAPPGLHRRRPPPPSPPPLKGNQFTWETLHSTYYYLPTTRRRFLTWSPPNIFQMRAESLTSGPIRQISHEIVIPSFEWEKGSLKLISELEHY